MSLGKLHKLHGMVLNRAFALVLALATVYGPLVGVALHNDGPRHAAAADDPRGDLHAAGCDHEESRAHHDASTCLVCRILSQAKTSALTRRSGFLQAVPAGILPPSAVAAPPTNAALTRSAPRAPPSLL